MDRATDQAVRRLGRTDEHGLKHLIARITAGDAAWIDAMLERIADILAQRPEHSGPTPTTRDELRSVAMGWLARPAELLELLLEHGDQSESKATAFPPIVTGEMIWTTLHGLYRLVDSIAPRSSTRPR